MSINKSALAKRIREAGEGAHIKAEQLAEICDISLSHINHLYCGDRQPSIEVLVRICNATGYSPNYLLQDSLEKTEIDELSYLTDLGKKLSPAQIKMVREIAKVISRN